ncbi:Kre28p [Rhodotorula paludigena]|uniref:Kre28p n=1 Tax=Rhodotorula paludigena TaxID=86838 RepID=UPI00317A06FE
MLTIAVLPVYSSPKAVLSASAFDKLQVQLDKTLMENKYLKLLLVEKERLVQAKDEELRRLIERRKDLENERKDEREHLLDERKAWLDERKDLLDERQQLLNYILAVSKPD